MSNFLIPNRPPKKNLRSIDEIIAEEKRKNSQKPKKGKPPEPEPEPDNPDIKGSIDFSIQKIGRGATGAVLGYRISGIQYQNNICVYDFVAETLPSRNQEQHADHALTAKKDDFVAASAPLIYSICKTLYQNKDSEQKVLVEKARKSLKNIIGPGKPWIHTLSRAIYKPKRIDEVIHDYKQKNQYKKQAKLVGPDGDITDKRTKAESNVQAVFDTDDSIQEINTIFQWITSKNSYAYRINSTPDTEQVRAVVLGVGSVDFCIFTYDDFIFSYIRPAFGVRRKKFSSGNKG